MTTENKSDKDARAQEQAKAQYDSIREMVATLECNYERLEELRDERKDLADAIKEAEEELKEAEKADDAAQNGAPDADFDLAKTVDEKREALEEARNALEDWIDEEELKELEAAAGECKDEDEARERIQEDPLSIEVRSDWTTPGEPLEASEFCILLCTGGPAARIVGDLDDSGEPYRARLEYQDWGTPWTEYFPASQDTLLTYARCFCFAS
jgi:hypothetical protein